MVIFCAFSLQGMKRPRTEITENTSKKQCILHAATITPLLDNLTFIIQQNMLPISTILDAHKIYFGTIQQFKNLYATNKTLHAILRNQNYMLNTIKHISLKFGYSHQTAARNLPSKETLCAQELFISVVKNRTISPSSLLIALAQAIKQNIDINFTYGNQQETSLAIALKQRKSPVNIKQKVKNILIDWHLQNNARISSIQKNGACVAKIILEGNDFAQLSKFLHLPHFNPHTLDSDENNLLHDCINTMARLKAKKSLDGISFDMLHNYLKQLLTMKVNPTQQNCYLTTPLILAKRLGDESIISLLEKHIKR
jgi:hypothetical protein